MATTGPKVTGKVKGGHHDRAYVNKNIPIFGNFTLIQAGPRVEWEWLFYNQMAWWSQERQRHKKRPVKSVNLTSPWKECALLFLVSGGTYFHLEPSHAVHARQIKD